MTDTDYAASAAARWQQIKGATDLDRYLVAMRVMRLAAVLQERLDETLAGAGFTVLGDYDVLSVLRRADEPLLPSDIATRLRLTRAGVTGRLHRLEADGLVSRQRSAEDSRNVFVTLTAQGRRTVDRAFERVVALENELFAELSDTDARQLGDLLAIVGRRHDPVD